MEITAPLAVETNIGKMSEPHLERALENRIIEILRGIDSLAETTPGSGEFRNTLNPEFKDGWLNMVADDLNEKSWQIVKALKKDGLFKDEDEDKILDFICDRVSYVYLAGDPKAKLISFAQDDIGFYANAVINGLEIRAMVRQQGNVFYASFRDMGIKQSYEFTEQEAAKYLAFKASSKKFSRLDEIEIMPRAEHPIEHDANPSRAEAQREKISVLLVKPGEYPQTVEIDRDLQSMQRLVGGYIEAIYPFDLPVALIYNWEGKRNALPKNRALYDADGRIYDFVAGSFFLAYASPDEDLFTSLPKELSEKYADQFKYPERFYRGRSGLIVKPYVPDTGIITPQNERETAR